MDVQRTDQRSIESAPLWSAPVAPLDVHHATVLHGATLTGEAARRELSVRIGVWLDETGSVRQARWRAVDDSSLRHFAEAACSLLERGADPRSLDAEALRQAASATAHGDRAEVVAAALHAALPLLGAR